MNISIKRDGLTLRGDLLRPNNEKSPVAIVFHGLMSKRGSIKLTEILLERGIAVVQFDFDGHGESDGDFSDMNVYSEILDVAKIIDYVRGLDFVTDIYIIGHSQGALVGGMIAGYYREYVKKLVMLAPAATIKDDAQKGSCFGIPYDIYNIPEYITMTNVEKEKFNVGGLYFRIARTLPIYETTSMFEGKTLIIHGSDDEAVGVIGSKRYKECMKNATLEIIEGENHGLNAFKWSDIVKRVTDFLV
ncbi:MAG: alpha/beta hydrolase [Candidatus Ornithomonoglobus sp.]